MPFQPGNTLWEAGSEAYQENKRITERLFLNLAGPLGKKFEDLLTKLSAGKVISPPQKEFMSHWKDLIEFWRPKLARNENVNENKTLLIQMSPLAQVTPLETNDKTPPKIDLNSKTDNLVVPTPKDDKKWHGFDLTREIIFVPNKDMHDQDLPDDIKERLPLS